MFFANPYLRCYYNIKKQIVLPGYRDSSQIIPSIAEEVERYLSHKGIFEDDVLGIGVGIPGPVSSTGVVNKCVNFSWGVFNFASLDQDGAIYGAFCLAYNTFAG